MKKSAIVILLALLTLSCSEDANNTDSTPTELEGRWTLVSASCFCFFEEDTDFSQHKIRFEGNNLTPVNTGQLQFLADSAGAFTLNGTVLILNDGSQYTYELKGDESLKLVFVDNPDLVDDELTLSYTRG